LLFGLLIGVLAVCVLFAMLALLMFARALAKLGLSVLLSMAARRERFSAVSYASEHHTLGKCAGCTAPEVVRLMATGTETTSTAPGRSK
jgi:hypothetical protein